jgi:choline dehydrogenase
VIVGGGSAGLFCALGLADRAEVTLLEAGIDPGSPSPDRFLHQHLYPDCDWDYTDADNGRHLVRGKVLGGSSTVNASAAVRGQPAAFDAWGTGWGWDDVLPGLRAVEHDLEFGDAPWHGDAGPVVVCRLPQGPLDDAFAAAAGTLGHAPCADHNAPGAIGVGPWPTNRVGGGRWGTLPAVAPLVRDQVTIRGCSAVRNVVIRDGRAVGVEIAGPHGSELIDADLIVLSAGAFGTPEVLWRSGVDRPAIGSGLQDHPWVMMDVFADPAAMAERPVSGGLLRAAIGGDPTRELQVFPFAADLYQPEVDPRTYRMSVSVMTPTSVGSMRQQGDSAAIRLGHLADDADVDAMVEAVTCAADVLDEMAAAGTVVLPDEPWWRSSGLAAELRGRVESYNHPVGTCGIGRVVDERLRVDGIDALRIADASVMPNIPSANTNLASMMIGWRAAEMIAADERL